MSAVGRVVRLQVQTGTLKRGERPRRFYDPSPLREVARLRLTPRGAEGIAPGGQSFLDVHHPGHPATKAHPGREVSFGFTRHYGLMRERYGEKMAIGCAGENILVESDRAWRLEDFAGGLAFESAVSGERMPLEAVTVAAPCVEFSRFALGDGQASPQQLKPVLQFLDAGTRGYVFTPGDDMELCPGDLLVLA